MTEPAPEAAPKLYRLLRDPRSLTRRLMSRAAIATLIGMVLIAFAAETVVASIINRNFDEQLELSSQLLVNLMYEELQSLGHQPAAARTSPQQPPLLSYEDRKAFGAYARWRTFHIWYGGQLRMASRSGPALALPSPADMGKFRVERLGGEEWRLYTFAAAGGDPVVEVGERMRVRNAMILHVSLLLAAPFMLIAALLVTALWFTLRDGLTGLQAFSAFLSRQKERPPFGELNGEEWPSELAGLVGVANSLFRRIETGIAHERQFIDLAAHQLRTPLAGLSMQAQLCARAPDQAELQPRLQNLYRSTRRVSALVDQLLNLAQIESSSEDAVPVSVHPILAGVIADLAPEASRRGVELAVEGADLTLTGSELAVQLMLSNLIGNAVKYTPKGGEVIVRLLGPNRIEVEDSGPGLGDAAKSQAFDRFWQQTPGTPGGSGLGLSIAREAAHRLGGDLSLVDRADGQSGLVVRFDASRP